MFKAATLTLTLAASALALQLPAFKVIALGAGTNDVEAPSAQGQSGTPRAQSPPAAPRDPASVARGDALYARLNCAACHGATGRGGPSNAPDLTRSAIAMAADQGRTLAAFLRTGRPQSGMPPLPNLTDAQAADLSAKLRSFGLAATGTATPGGGRQGTPLHPEWPVALTGQQLSIVGGDAAQGQKFFNGPVGQCGSCHAVKDGEPSTALNLAHVAAKYPDPKTLQNTMLLNRGGTWSPRTSKDVTAVVTYADGRNVRGYLSSVSDFKVVIRDESGTERDIARADGDPQVVLGDRLQHHIDLVGTYRDDDIHNLTAYLVTLK